MDTIYKRTRLPILTVFFNRRKRIKRLVVIVVILIIAITTFRIIINSITPVFEKACRVKIINLATEIINNESSKVLDKEEYSKLVSIIKDEESGTNILETNVVTINRVSSEIAVQIEKQLEEIKNKNINIPIGAITGMNFLSGVGPNINIKMIPMGNVFTQIKTEFNSSGINQTVYRIYLELKCKTSILTPYNTIEEEITSQVLLVETIIVGEIPETYYNLEGMSSDDTLNILE